MTNYEKIQKMSIEELAKLLKTATYNSCNSFSICNYEQNNNSLIYKCEDCKLRWLQANIN